ncbi:serine/threonine-protein kinase GCN2 [Carex littledalei]|uniref:Serine/threonine-protein kinase GCN2 n=1 Tax=Carex littledalei TaxID=544730 RepID=A0A833VYY4_9POAL|nr:serine/threonine-protein kinase GCN2 [Carex littledalei]
MAHIHSHGIIHGDLKLGNILFDGRNDVKIGDSGLGGQSDHDQKLQITIRGASGDDTRQIGTFPYSAPELEKDGPQIDEKVDIYSLGVILFELWYPFSTRMEIHEVLL